MPKENPAVARPGEERPRSEENLGSEANRPKPPRQQKWKRILRILASGEELNRFDAAKLGDSCLNSTVPKIEARGIRVSRRMITVPGWAGHPTRCTAYWLEPAQRERARKILRGAT